MTTRVLSQLPNDREHNAHYAELREAGPVHRIVLPDGAPIWLVTRYDDVRAALSDERLALDPRELSSPRHKFGGKRVPGDILASSGRHMLNTDGDEHRRLRSLVYNELTAGAVTRWRPGVETVVEAQLDELAERAGNEPVNLMPVFANAVPAAVIGMVLGIAPDDMSIAARLIRELLTDRKPDSPEMIGWYHELIDLILATVKRKRARPGADLISSVLSRPEKVGDRDLLSTIMALLVGGPPTTATTLAYGTVLLSGEPELAQRVVDDSDAAASLIEELLRHHAPFPFASWRFATEDLELGGIRVPKDATVLLSLTTANRDPRKYANADKLCPGRTDKPTHLSFGNGAHRCVGASLARLELGIALPALFRRFPDLELAVAPDELVWTTFLFDRRLESLPVWPRGRLG
ncbi:cytochrome P450 [Amycolatopsis keratiniphila]|uniref:cytochrome P450 n=1 Tax=Amycolatopsis keratiniphila TaxID=129921 RepID=UPI0033EA3168